MPVFVYKCPTCGKIHWSREGPPRKTEEHPRCECGQGLYLVRVEA
jgi:predicted RNA-binding Zn-ribbon protein involved in translation (DUF1610 family)